MQQHDAVGGEEARGGAEEGGELRQADVLEHADGDDVVELALDLAVVLEAEAHPVGEAGGGGALGGDPVLLAREGDAGDVGAGDAGEVERHAAPAAADVEDAGAGADEELGGDQALLGELGLVERHAGVFEEGAGILHVAVEKEPVEPFVEVVVMGDVGAGGLEADGADHRGVGDAAPEVEALGGRGGELGARVVLGERDEVVDVALLDDDAAVHVHLGEGEAGIEEDAADRAGVGEAERKRAAAAVAIGLLVAGWVDDAEASAGDLIAENGVEGFFEHSFRHAIGR